MSSMAEGSEGREREDELDLGPEEDDSQLPDHGALPDLSPQEPLEDELDTIEDHAPDHASEKTVQAVVDSLPQTPPQRNSEFAGAAGSLDETASTPDDSPSLHVSVALRRCIWGELLTPRRTLSSRHKVVAFCRIEALRRPVLVQPTDPSTSASNLVYRRHR